MSKFDIGGNFWKKYSEKNEQIIKSYLFLLKDLSKNLDKSINTELLSTIYFENLSERSPDLYTIIRFLRVTKI